MAQLRVRAWNAEGVQVKDSIIEDLTDEGPEFYVHQLRHINGVVCAEVSDGHTTVRLCDPRFAFSDVVRD